MGYIYRKYIIDSNDFLTGYDVAGGGGRGGGARVQGGMRYEEEDSEAEGSESEESESDDNPQQTHTGYGYILSVGTEITEIYYSDSVPLPMLQGV